MIEPVGELLFPPAWLEGKEWLLGPEILFTGTVADGHLIVAGGVLDDGTNLLGLCYSGGQRLARCSPDTGWSIEEHFDGEEPAADAEDTVRDLWANVITSMAGGLRAARGELGRCAHPAKKATGPIWLRLAQALLRVVRRITKL